MGPHAEEVSNIFAPAIRLGHKAKDLKLALFAYLTNRSDMIYMLK